jgi:hypothetical protein
MMKAADTSNLGKDLQDYKAPYPKKAIFMVNSGRNSRFLINGTGMINSAIEKGQTSSDVSEMQYIGGLGKDLQFRVPTYIS